VDARFHPEPLSLPTPTQSGAQAGTTGSITVTNGPSVRLLVGPAAAVSWPGAPCPELCRLAPAMTLASRRAAGERPPRGAYGGRSRLCGRILWRRLSGWMRYRPAAGVVDSGGVMAGSADFSLGS